LSVEDFFAKANELFTEGDIGGALEMVNNGIEIEPDEPKLWYNKGVYEGRLERHIDAVGSFEKALELRPDYAAAWFNKAVALISLGRAQKAVDAVTRVIELEPGNGMAWFNRACYNSLQRKASDVLDDLSKALELEPSLKEAALAEGVFVGLEDDPKFRELMGQDVG